MTDSRPPTLSIPKTIAQLRAKAEQPFELGRACADPLGAIHVLVSYHLGNAANYKNTPLRSHSFLTDELIYALDAALQSMRTADGNHKAFPDDLLADRKERRPRRKFQKTYTASLERRFKQLLRTELKDILSGYCVERTQQFNKGFNAMLDGTPWAAYPCVNVVLEAGLEDDWGAWLRSRCDELGIVRSKQGKPALEAS